MVYECLDVLEVYSLPIILPIILPIVPSFSVLLVVAGYNLPVVPTI